MAAVRKDNDEALHDIGFIANPSPLPAGGIPQLIVRVRSDNIVPRHNC